MADKWEPYLQRIREMAESGMTDKEMFDTGQFPCETFGALSVARYRHGILSAQDVKRLSKLPIISRVVSDSAERVILAPEGSEEEPITELWDRAVKRTGREQARARLEGRARVRIMTDRPIAISLSSDWHVTTSEACDLPGLRTYAEAIRDAPGAYALGVGDMANNPIKWNPNMNEVPDEWRLVGHLFGLFGLKLLGVTSGNHDDWTKKFAGVDTLRAIAERGRVHFAPDELVWTVEIVSPSSGETTATYVIATRHKFRRNSNLNWTHACWRWMEERTGQWPLDSEGGELVPDIIAIGDSHVASTEARDFANKQIWAARMGPWQAGSAYARAKGFSSCPPTAPTFILYPDKSEPIVGHPHYQKVLRILEAERAAWGDR